MQITHFRLLLANGTEPGNVLLFDACVHAKKILAEPLHCETVPIVHLEVGSEVEALQMFAVLGADWNFDARSAALEQTNVYVVADTV